MNDSYINYDLKSQKDKELYVNSVKRNLQEFSLKKNESKKNRDDFFAGLDEQIDTLYKKKHNEANEAEIEHDFGDEVKHVDEDDLRRKQESFRVNDEPKENNLTGMIFCVFYFYFIFRTRN
jgi:hypothetical protein